MRRWFPFILLLLATSAFANVPRPRSFPRSNRLTNMVDAAGTTAFTYTPAGQLQSEDGPWANDTVTYGYSQQLRSALSLAQSATNWSQAYGYDSAWRLTSLTSPAGGFLYEYPVGTRSTASLIQKLSLPNGAYITNHYDSLARLDSTALVNHWGHVLDGYTYQMDLLGLRTNVTRDFGLSTNIVSAGYDNIGQLTSWTGKEASGVPRLNEQNGWAYDKAHNLQFRTNNALIQTFTVDPVNELTNVTRSGTFTATGNTPAPISYLTVNGATANFFSDFTFAKPDFTLTNGINTFTVIAANPYGLWNTNTLTVNLPATNALQFDLNGNLTNDGTKSFTFDAENQLTTVSVVGQWKSEFVYDGLNRRRIARDYTWTGSAWSKTNEVRYLCDGMLPIQERDTNNNVLVTYTRGLDLSSSLQGAGGIGGLLARTDGSGSTFYHADGSGNVTAMMDGYENMVARYLYHPFGKQIGQWGALAGANVMRFSSMPVHPLSGMPHFPLRDLGDSRWIQRDPIGEAGGINLYGFVGNNPVSRIDPLGWWWWDRGLIQVGGPQLLHDLFIGDNNSSGADPNSQGALSANAGYGFHPLYDADGNALGNPASAVGGAVVGGLVDAASLFAGGGEAKGAIKCEKAAANWLWPKGKGVAKMLRQVEQRGWTPQLITEAIQKGEQFAAQNLVNPGNPAIRYINPTTGQSIVLDTVTKEVIHVGGPGFKY